MVGSRSSTSSPTSAFAIAARIALVGSGHGVRAEVDRRMTWSRTDHITGACGVGHGRVPAAARRDGHGGQSNRREPCNRSARPVRPSGTNGRGAERARVDQRDEQEFAEYFVARRDAVRRSAYLLCGDWHRADDLAQTAFVALHRQWHKIRDRAALDAYVRRTVVRAVIDESRRPWRRERFTDEVPEARHVGRQAGRRRRGRHPAPRWSRRCTRCRPGSGRCWCCASWRDWT